MAFGFLVGCSEVGVNEINEVVPGEEMGQENDDTATNDDNNNDGSNNDGTNDDTSNVTDRFSFVGEIVIENSWDTMGCDSPPCDTIDESLDNFFEVGQPDDPYFKMAEDESELFLECQLEKGRRIEFKQRSEGPLSSSARMEFEGVYYDIPDGGMTIAQVHNRGGNGNKPFFRLELHSDKLETVIRKDPEVSSSMTTFDKVDYPLFAGENYDQSPLTIVLEKSAGAVSIKVMQKETVILEQSFQPDSSTRWVTDSGIANGFYLKAGLYNAATTHTKNLVLGYTTFKFQTEDQ